MSSATPAQFISDLITKAQIGSEQKFGQDGIAEIERTILSGSYARFTANYPLNDVDILMVLKPGTKLNSHLVEKMLRRLRYRVQNRTFLPSATIRAQDKSIGIDLRRNQPGLTGADRITFDVIPALKLDDGGYEILSKSDDSHTIKTWPHLAKDKVEQLDQRKFSGGYFRKMIRLLKAWNA